jgi:hypothetical protein
VRWSTIAAVSTSDPPGNPLESDEGRRPVAAVHHHVFDVTVASISPVNVLSTLARVIFDRSSPSLYGFSALDAELGARCLLHAAAPQSDIIVSTRRPRASTAAINAFSASS